MSRAGFCHRPQFRCCFQRLKLIIRSSVSILSNAGTDQWLDIKPTILRIPMIPAQLLNKVTKVKMTTMINTETSTRQVGQLWLLPYCSLLNDVAIGLCHMSMSIQNIIKHVLNSGSYNRAKCYFWKEISCFIKKKFYTPFLRKQGTA